jgi:hypothetical protein
MEPESKGPYFPAVFAFAHLVFWAAAMRARPAALIVRFPDLVDDFGAFLLALLVGPPANRALASWSRSISASIAARISFVSILAIIK